VRCGCGAGAAQVRCAAGADAGAVRVRCGAVRVLMLYCLACRLATV